MASRRTALWLLTTFLFLLLGFTLLVWGLNRLLVGATPTVGSGTILDVRLQGEIGELAQRGPFVGPLTVREIDDAIRRAADDTRVAGLFLDVGPLFGGFAKTQEIRAAVAAFKASGKPVIALLESGSNLDLYAAAAADTIFQVPSGQLVLGLLVQQPFYRDLLDKLGARLEVFASGPYKTAFHSFVNRSMTDAQREMSESLLASIYEQWLAAVAEDRGLTREQLAAVFDEGLVSARRAREAGLVDELGYRDEVDARLAEVAGRSPRRLGVREYLRATAPSAVEGLLARDNVIALIHVSGLMVPGEVEDGLFASNVVGGATIAGYVREARRDAAVKAIVMRIDSGGGAATAADVMGREIELAAQSKPVVASMSDVAGSGGYWIASKASWIVADPGTYTGSIGVVMGKLDLQGTYELLGVEHELLRAGENADLLSEAAGLRPEQAALLEAAVEETYRDFIAVVAAGRDMDAAAVDAVAQGRVWTGAQAVERGLVDELGGLREALDWARSEADIGPRERLTIRTYPPRRTLFEELSRAFTTVAAGGIPGGVAGRTAAAVFSGWERVQLLRAAGPLWTLMDAALPAAAR
jgi:protease-4